VKTEMPAHRKEVKKPNLINLKRFSYLLATLILCALLWAMSWRHTQLKAMRLLHYLLIGIESAFSKLNIYAENRDWQNLWYHQSLLLGLSCMFLLCTTGFLSVKILAVSPNNSVNINSENSCDFHFTSVIIM
jgi:hypothetical protein